jgi:catechol 2,3-dioxygenase-like lactoylglutathione lyase family enzyme
MNILGINHINIVVTSGQLPDVVAFYEQVLGLRKGPRAVSKRDGAWLYCQDTAIIHLSVVEMASKVEGNAHFNHVALLCSDVENSRRTLEAYHIEYTIDCRSTPPPGMAQLFFYDPVGIRIELNFPGEEITL